MAVLVELLLSFSVIPLNAGIVFLNMPLALPPKAIVVDHTQSFSHFP
jgi:hypothetical protein